MNINVKDALTLMVEVFAHQIFISGFVHADPHPGIFNKNHFKLFSIFLQEIF